MKIPQSRSVHYATRVLNIAYFSWGIRIFIVNCNKCVISARQMSFKLWIKTKIQLLVRNLPFFITVHNALAVIETNISVSVTIQNYMFKRTFFFPPWTIKSPPKIVTFPPESPFMYTMSFKKNRPVNFKFSPIISGDEWNWMFDWYEKPLNKKSPIANCMQNWYKAF